MRDYPMKNSPLIALASALFIASMTAVFTAPQGPAPPAAQTPSSNQAGADLQVGPDASKQMATLTQYCVACHNDRTKTAGASFQGLTPETIGQHAELLEKAVRKMRGRVMPPPGARQPDAATADALIAFLERSLDRTTSQAHLRDKVVLHRLNRKEYTNAVRDLLAVEFDATSVLPADDVLEGFDNIAEALQVSPSFIEQYVKIGR